MTKTLKTITGFTLTFAAVFASACNTVEGIGQDAESVGDKAEEVTRN